jgi:hypothetical protein
MKKFSVVLAGVILLSFLLSGCSALLPGKSSSSQQAATVLVKSDDGTMSLSVPKAWNTSDKDLADLGEIGVSNDIQDLYIVAGKKPKSDFKKGYTISDYMTVVVEGMNKTLENPKSGKISKLKINGSNTLSVEISGIYQNINLVYWYYIIDGKENFYEAYGWTTNSKAKTNEPTINNIIKSFKANEQTALSENGKAA